MAAIALSTLPGVWKDIPEAGLVAVVCATISFTGYYKKELPFDIEISILKPLEILPSELGRSWTFKGKYKELVSFYNKLQIESVDGQSYLEVIPIFGESQHHDTGALSGNKYYIHEKYHNDFMYEYWSFNGFLMNLLNESEDDDVDNYYLDDWEPNDDFIKSSKLIWTPRDGVNTDRIHIMLIPTYIWNLPKIDNIYQEQLGANLVGLFLRDCFEDDHKRLMDKTCYLRFYLCQDAPDSYPYVHAYIRSIDDCAYESHKASLRSISVDSLPCEVNYATRGYFWAFPLEEWKSKSLKHIKQFL